MPGHPAKFFADSTWGSEQKALKAAREWRDARWDGEYLNRKLSAANRNNIRRSKKHYIDVAADYDISPNYVHQIRRGL